MSSVPYVICFVGSFVADLFLSTLQAPPVPLIRWGTPHLFSHSLTHSPSDPRYWFIPCHFYPFHTFSGPYPIPSPCHLFPSSSAL
jgi:hypothetical protein